MTTTSKRPVRSPRFFLAAVIIDGTLAAIFALGGVLFFIYGCACAAAFDGPVIPLTIFACSFLCVGFTLGFGALLIAALKRMPHLSGAPSYDDQHASKDGIITSWSVLKDWLTLPNFTLAFLALGVLLAVISAFSGGLENHKWKECAEPLLVDNGYYSESHFTQMHYDNTLKSINFDLNEKNAVVIFTSEVSDVQIDAYCFYEDELTYNNFSNGVLTLSQTDSPRNHKALDNMFWFLFDGGNDVEKQVLIYVPNSWAGKITFNGEHTVAR